MQEQNLPHLQSELKMKITNSIPVSQIAKGDNVEYATQKFSKVKSIRPFKGVGGQSVTLYLVNGVIVSYPQHGEVRIKI